MIKTSHLLNLQFQNTRFQIRTIKKTKLLLLVICFLTSLTNVRGQEVTLLKNSLFFEFFGNGGLYSVNYERSVKPNLYGRVGFSSFKSFSLLSPGPGSRITTIPLLITYFTGRKIHHFEISGGMLLGRINGDNESNSIINLTAFKGYRYQAPGEGILIRIGFTPFVTLDNEAYYPDKGLNLFGGLSIWYHS